MSHINAANAVILFTPEGETKSYVPLAARLPEFLHAFPPEKYSVLTEYEPCPLAGDRPVFIFKASLVDAQGRVVATAHSRRSADLFKDFESGETSARQRLLAALGFGGEILQADEYRDFQAQGITAKAQGPEPTRSRPRMKLAHPALREVVQEQHPVSATNDEAVVESEKDHIQASAVASVPDDTDESEQSPSGEMKPAMTTSGVSPVLKRQLEALCASRGINPPTVGSDDEARKAISSIARSRRG